MRPRTLIGVGAAAILIVPIGAVAVAGGATATDSRHLTLVKQFHPTSIISSAKSATSSLAQTDRSLLGRKDSTRIPVVIKLDYDSVATYAGDVRGLAATSPAVTGHKLRGSSAEKKYESYVAGREAKFAYALHSAVPSARLGRALTTVYGGVAAVLPANEISSLLRVPGVVAVQKDELRQPLTDSSTKFIGADSLNDSFGGASNAGKGVIFGSLDSGVWPEHPSFADTGTTSAPPAKADGTARKCDFGDNPLTPEPDIFVCNNKLIGGAGFLNTYTAVVGPEKFGKTARDSDGHGTHTASTAAGDVVASAKVFGVERGPIRGVAPGAWISVYKVCGEQGCFSSDSAAAVEQAIADGVNVINFSISGGSNPFTDPVELAFLDAYAAGVFVSASAGNSGPGAGTTDHVSPWVTTVAASTQTREFSSTLTLQSGADSLVLTGSSIMGGVATQTPVVVPAADPFCLTAAPAGTYTGQIVVCKRGGGGLGRVSKGFNVAAGGAAGMILYNPTLADTETDNHWLPALHLAVGTDLLAFLSAHPAGVTAAFTPGVKADGQGDVMAAFSSRGPGGFGIKPDITAPGVQILAGHTPVHDDGNITVGPEGELYQAIAGTSMSSPHIAGSAILEKSLHPSWTPGQIKSALMTTATTSVVKEDGVTPADPFDDGSGRVDLTKAHDPGLTFDETAADMALLGGDKIHAIDLNLPSINAPVMPGSVTTFRTAVNVTNRTQEYKVSTTAPADSRITVWPREFKVRPGRSVTLRITISSSAPKGQYFGEIRLRPDSRSLPVLHLPVGFVPQQADINLTSTCAATSIPRDATTDCTITATNNSPVDSEVSTSTTVNDRLKVVSATGATRTGRRSVMAPTVTLGGAHPGVPSVADGSTPAGGYLPLESVSGLDPATPIGDEELRPLDVPDFVYNGRTFNKIAIDSNGYLIAGGTTSSADNECCNISLPSGAAPNNILAPFWTDLNGAGAPGITVAELSRGAKNWLVVQWDVNVFGTTDTRHFQVWIGLNGTQDISWAYSTVPTDPGQPFAIGAENSEGAGQAFSGFPASDVLVTSTAPTPGGSQSYTVTVKGDHRGTGVVTSTMDSPSVSGSTIVRSTIDVTRN